MELVVVLPADCQLVTHSQQLIPTMQKPLLVKLPADCVGNDRDNFGGFS